MVDLLVRDGEFSEVVSDHVRLYTNRGKEVVVELQKSCQKSGVRQRSRITHLDFDEDVSLSVVDSDLAGDHLTY